MGGFILEGLCLFPNDFIATVTGAFFFLTKGGGGRGCISLNDDFWTSISKKRIYYS